MDYTKNETIKNLNLEILKFQKNVPHQQIVTFSSSHLEKDIKSVKMNSRTRSKGLLLEHFSSKI